MKKHLPVSSVITPQNTPSLVGELRAKKLKPHSEGTLLSSLDRTKFNCSKVSVCLIADRITDIAKDTILLRKRKFCAVLCHTKFINAGGPHTF